MQRGSVYSKMTQSEKEVANVLKELRIQWTYEQPVFVYDENKRPRVWAPDFYLKHFGIYIEVCGSEKFDYDYRRRIFAKNGYPVIFLHIYKDSNKWKNHLLNFLYVFTHGRYQKLHEIIERRT